MSRDPGRIRIAAGFVALAVWASPAPSRPGEPATGFVVGTVRLLAAPASRAPMLSPYARPRYRPPARTEAASGSPENVVVYLVSDEPPAQGARASVEITQRNRTILPHVSVVQTGTSVVFPNEDDVFHNIFSLSGPKRFNLGRYPPGESRSEVFPRPGVVRLFCDIHSEMGGVILVVATPYFTRPDAQGAFRIADVPEGEYTAIVWHEAAGADSVRVVVRPGAEARVDFTLGG